MFIEIYFSDLIPSKQQEIMEAFGDNNNFDIFPLWQMEVDEDDQT